jgi:RNA recognition motif-containing protein
MGTKLYVGNLSYDTIDSGLESAFAQVGTVVEATVITDRYSGRSRGFGFVEMADEASAAEAIQKLDGQTLDGRTIKVAEAKPRAPRDDRGGYGGGGSNSRW